MTKLQEYLGELRRCTTDDEIDELFERIVTDYNERRIEWEDLQTLCKALAQKHL